MAHAVVPVADKKEAAPEKAAEKPSLPQPVSVSPTPDPAPRAVDAEKKEAGRGQALCQCDAPSLRFLTFLWLLRSERRLPRPGVAPGGGRIHTGADSRDAADPGRPSRVRNSEFPVGSRYGDRAGR